MILAEQLTKKFGSFCALDALNAQIPAGKIYGLVGPNGSGKSTFLRLLAGVYRPDGGSITIHGAPVYENTPLKQTIAFVPDELYFLSQSTLEEMAAFYRGFYANWSQQRYQTLCNIFPLDPKKRLSTFSKGMKRQAALLLALSCQPKYLLLDEAFDGLDPVIRLAVKRLLADEMAQRDLTVLISSHNLRELEDLCDQVGLLHQGHILFEQELDALKLGFCKVQAAFSPMIAPSIFSQQLDLLQMQIQGSIAHLVVRGGIETVQQKLAPYQPLFVEALPLTLEEVFIYEMEAVGYDYSNILF